MQGRCRKEDRRLSASTPHPPTLVLFFLPYMPLPLFHTLPHPTVLPFIFCLKTNKTLLCSVLNTLVKFFSRCPLERLGAFCCSISVESGLVPFFGYNIGIQFKVNPKNLYLVDYTSVYVHDMLAPFSVYVYKDILYKTRHVYLKCGVCDVQLF